MRTCEKWSNLSDINFIHWIKLCANHRNIHRWSCWWLSARRRNSTAYALELHLSCTNPSMSECGLFTYILQDWLTDTGATDWLSSAWVVRTKNMGKPHNKTQPSLNGVHYFWDALKLTQLEQLERLRSEIPPTAPWLPILMIHITSQVKTRQSQSYQFKKIAKNTNF